MKMKVTLSVFLAIFLLGCGQDGTIENSLEKKEVALEQNEVLENLGLSIEEQRISLDMNKTADFLKRMEIEMHGKADEIQHKIEKADINFTRDMGVTFSKEKVEIDLNKTKNMFQEINILMKEVLLESNSSKD